MRKYKLFVKIALFIMCVLPLVMIVLYPFTDPTTPIDEININVVAEKFSLSHTLEEHITSAFETMQMPLDGQFSMVVPVILSNTLIIYIAYLFTLVLIFIPKMAIYFLNMPFKSNRGDI